VARIADLDPWSRRQVAYLDREIRRGELIAGLNARTARAQVRTGAADCPSGHLRWFCQKIDLAWNRRLGVSVLF